VIWSLRRGKGEKVFGMIVIVLLLCGGTVVELFGIVAMFEVSGKLGTIR
jgi:hypothetical protein